MLLPTTSPDGRGPFRLSWTMSTSAGGGAGAPLRTCEKPPAARRQTAARARERKEYLMRYENERVSLAQSAESVLRGHCGFGDQTNGSGLAPRPDKYSSACTIRSQARPSP